jgi:hypothetical protein
MAVFMLENQLQWSILLLLILKKANVAFLQRGHAIVRKFINEFNIGGGYCNFMHLKHISRDLIKDCKYLMYQEYPDYRDQRK